MKYYFIRSFITAISLIVIMLSSCSAYRDVRTYDMTYFEKYYSFKVLNKSNDTIILPYLVFQRYDICSNMTLNSENQEVRITIDLNLEKYFDDSQNNMVFGHRLNYFENIVPSGHSGLFFLPRCDFLQGYNLIDTLQNSKMLFLEINNTNFKIPLNSITEVGTEIELDSSYNGLIFSGMRLKK